MMLVTKIYFRESVNSPLKKRVVRFPILKREKLMAVLSIEQILNASKYYQSSANHQMFDNK